MWEVYKRKVEKDLGIDAESRKNNPCQHSPDGQHHFMVSGHQWDEAAKKMMEVITCEHCGTPGPSMMP